MESIGEYWKWISDNWPQVVIIVSGLLATAEAITKMTPTESDDSFVERIGKSWTKIIAWIPSNKKEPKA